VIELQALAALADTTICDTQIPAGTRLILQTRHAGRNANGAEYDPERWLDDDERECPTRSLFPRVRWRSSVLPGAQPCVP